MFADADRGGVQQAGEVGLGGRVVFGDYDYDDGRYTIRGLPANGQSVAIRLLDLPASRVTAPAGGAHSIRIFDEGDYGGRDFGIIV